VLYGFLEKAPFGAKAGICEHGIEATESLQSCRYEGLLVIPLGDIAAQSDCLVLTTQISCQLRQSVLSPGAEYYPPTLGHGTPRRLGADARRGAGDQ